MNVRYRMGPLMVLQIRYLSATPKYLGNSFEIQLPLMGEDNRKSETKKFTKDEVLKRMEIIVPTGPQTFDVVYSMYRKCFVSH